MKKKILKKKITINNLLVELIIKTNLQENMKSF